jgi:uncharacterized phage protein (TIGR01671 family)
MKFRVWSKNEKKFLDTDDCFLSGNGKLYVYDNMDGNIIKAPNDVVIQQFTGLYDKNNNPIYEGDVVEVNKYTSVTATVDYKLGEWVLDGVILLKDFYSMDKRCNVLIVTNIFEKDITI